MANVDLTAQSVEQLRATLKRRRTIQWTVLAIFGIIIAAWLVLGLWRKNLPVFISTVAMTVAITMVQSASTQSVVQELRRRGEDPDAR